MRLVVHTDILYVRVPRHALCSMNFFVPQVVLFKLLLQLRVCVNEKTKTFGNDLVCCHLEHRLYLATVICIILCSYIAGSVLNFRSSGRTSSTTGFGPIYLPTCGQLQRGCYGEGESS